MKVAILNDTHVGIRNSSNIFIDYQEAFYQKIFFPYLREHGIKTIMHLGDYYENRKFINFKALHSNRKVFLETLREEGIHMDIIPGNHDVYYKNTNKLNALKELLGHYMNEVNIVTEPRVLEYGTMRVAMIPWITQDNYNKTMSFLETCEADLVAGHFELNGFDMAPGMPCTGGMDPDPLRRFDRVISGHFHCKSSNGNIDYLGSQMEFFWNDAHQKKYFHVLDTDTHEITPVLNPLTIFEKIYYDDEKNDDYLTRDLEYLDHKFVKLVVMNRSDNFTFDRFIDRINERKIHELKISENFQEFMGENVADSDVDVEDTQTLLNSYVESVETSLDRDRLKSIMHRLMTEAQSLEIV